MRRWLRSVGGALPGVVVGSVGAVAAPVLDLGPLLLGLLASILIWPRSVSTAALLMSFGIGLIALTMLRGGSLGWVTGFAVAPIAVGLLILAASVLREQGDDIE